MMSMKLSDIAILNLKSVDYRRIININFIITYKNE